MGNQQLSTQTEIYKVHPIYTELEISNFGNIRTTATGKPRYTNINKQGYLITQIKYQGKIKTLKIHRLVAETHLDPPDEKLVEKCRGEHHGKVLVKHLDNNPLNNHVSNLEWSDLHGNTKQAWDDGLIPVLRGELNGGATLTDELVHDLCKDYESGMMPKEAIEKYGISRSQATKIRAGFQWKHIWEQYNIKVNRRRKSSSTIM